MRRKSSLRTSLAALAAAALAISGLAIAPASAAPLPDPFTPIIQSDASAEITLEITSPKETYQVGDRVGFTIRLKNLTDKARSFRPASSNLTNYAGCRWVSAAPGATLTCGFAYHVLTEADAEAGQFTPEITYQMHDAADYNSPATVLPTTTADLIAVHWPSLAIGDVTVGGTKDRYTEGDVLTFDVTLASQASEPIRIVTGDSTIQFAGDGCDIASLEPGAEFRCEQGTYALTDEDLERGRITASLVVRAYEASADGALLQAVAHTQTVLTPGIFEPASAFTLPDADPTLDAMLSDPAVLAKNAAPDFYRIPAITVASNGDVLASYDLRPNSAADSPNPNSIVQRRSTDGGKTWRPQSYVSEGRPGSQKVGYSDPSYVVDNETGTIFNFHVKSFDQGFWGGNIVRDADGNIDESARSTMNLGLAVSTDDGHTWEQRVITAQVLGDLPEVKSGFASSGQGIQIQHGPYAGRLVQQYAWLLRNGDVVASSVFSDDHGQTWQSGGFTPLNLRKADGSPLYWDENKVVELADGRLMLNSRAQGGYRLVTYSADGGETWGPAAVETELIDPTNNAQIIRAFPNAEPGTPESDVLLFTNAKNQRTRTNGTISASCDSGETWLPENAREFYGGHVGYSTIAVQRDGSLGLLYERDGNTISYQRFTLDWVKDNLCDLDREAMGEGLVALDSALDDYVAAGDVAGPIVERLDSAITLAQKHREERRFADAIDAVERFRMFVADAKRPDTMADAARQDLLDRADALLT